MSERTSHWQVFSPRFRRAIIFILFKLVDAGLSMLGYRRVCQYLLLLSPRPDPANIQFSVAFSAARLVNQAATQSVDAGSCLRRSLLLWWLLRWRRIPTDLRIGVNPEGGHAWVEHHGKVINDNPDVVAKYSIVHADQLTPEGVAGLR